MFKQKNSTGITLIECIISIALSFIILNIIFAIYLVSERSHMVQSALISIEENARIIDKIITQAIHSAGYIGCAKLTELFPFKNHLNFPLNEKNKIVINEKEDKSFFNTWHADSRNIMLTKDMRSYSILYATASLLFSANDLVIISDCKTAEAFQIKEATILSDGSQRIVSAVPLDKLYDKNTALYKLAITSYFIADTGRLDNKKHIIYSLFSKNYEGAKKELVEGVNQMKIVNELVGVSFQFDLIAVNYFDLVKKWYFYVALR